MNYNYTTGRPQSKPLNLRFWKKVDKRSDNECWPWTGATIPSGRGRLGVGNREFYATRISYWLKYGDLDLYDSSVLICHTCDNPNCVNPKHLYKGSHADNSQDMAKKGRSTIGERHPRAKLCQNEVDAIRSIYAETGVRYRDLAVQFEVRKGTICDIIRGKNWK